MEELVAALVAVGVVLWVLIMSGVTITVVLERRH